MRVIITGGTGMIGRALAAELTEQYEVVVLSRNPDNHSGRLPSGVKIEQWDARSDNGWGHLADGAYAIINLAGADIAAKRWSKDRKEIIRDSRVHAGQAVTAAISKAKVKPQVLIQASAIGFYGTENANRVLDETSPAGSDFLADVVQAWESSSAGVSKIGVRHVVARIGIVLSTEGGALPKLVKPFEFLAGGPLGNGEQWMSWIHIEDTVRALCHLLQDQTAAGIYNITAPHPIQNAVMAENIGNILSKPGLVPAPALALKVALGEMATLVVDGQRVVPKRLLKQRFMFRYTDIETALRQLL